MKTRKQLEDMYGVAAVVDEIIRSKTESGAFVDAPDAPHMLEARLPWRAHSCSAHAYKPIVAQAPEEWSIN